MQANVGLLDRYIRLVSGLLIFGSGVGLRRGSPLARGTLMSIGAMKIAEGVTGWCPVMHACGIRSNEQQQGEGSRQHNQVQQQGAGQHGQTQQQGSHQHGQTQQQGSGQQGQSQQHYQNQAPASSATGNNYAQQASQSSEGGQRRKVSGSSRRTHKRDDNQATEAVAASLQ